MQMENFLEFIKIIWQNRLLKAFTLAEVLIALTIIGVVAALVVPTMIQSYQEKVTVSKVRNVYSTLSQAVYLSKIDNGPIETWDWSSATNAFANLKPYLKVQKDCGTGKGCWYDGYTKALQGSNHVNWDSVTSYAKVILADGTSLALSVVNGTTGEILVDINGKVGPNTYGKDVFELYIRSNRIVPRDNTNVCNINNNTDINNGTGCTLWVIEKGNMDYLRKQISW